MERTSLRVMHFQRSCECDKVWRQLLDHKYQTCSPNIFQAKALGSSEFFKVIMWDIQATKMGYIWKNGNSRKVCFWEDN